MGKIKGVDYQRHFSYPQALKRIRDLEKENETLRDEVSWEWMFNIQFALDAAAIELTREFDFTPEQNKRVQLGMKKVLIEYMQMSLKEVQETYQAKNADGTKCEDFWVTQAKMDRELRCSLGDDVPDWTTRNDTMHLIHELAEFKRLKDQLKSNA